MDEAKREGSERWGRISGIQDFPRKLDQSMLPNKGERPDEILRKQPPGRAQC